MPPPNPQEQHVPPDLFGRAHVRAATLKQRLPDEVFEPIAKEVLRRVAEARPSLRTFDLPERQREITELCAALLSTDDKAAIDFIEARRLDGLSLEEMYLGYLSEAARSLGVMWDEDRVSFVDVAIGTSRIYAIMRTMSARFRTPAAINEKSALFASVPGEAHTLGIDMAADLFRKEGWEIELKTGQAHDQLVAEIRVIAPRLIGLSAGGKRSLKALGRLVVALRLATPCCSILVSGNILSEAGDTVEAMDVDAVAYDVQSARAMMEGLWNEARRAH
ncbi:MAG: cobalamin-dependent protein [Pseudomonadota bacterium]